MNLKINISDITNFILMGLLFLYFFLFNEVNYALVVDPILVMVFSVLFVVKARKNNFILILALFILYSNYSIVIGEYIVGGELSVPYTQVKTDIVYGLTIRILLLFMSILSLFYKGKSIDPQIYKITRENNNIIFWGFILLLIYIMIFGVDPSSSATYTVNITPLYGYAPIFFMFAFYYMGQSRGKILLLTAFAIAFTVQDFYYGGRITSLQILILYAISIFPDKLKGRNIVASGIIGIILLSLVSSYRTTYSLSNINFANTIDLLFENYLVFDTPIGAYYASATHVAATQIATINQRLGSFLHFIVSIFFGTTTIESNLTLYVSEAFELINGGGGLIPTNFFFWMGWPGVVLISSILVSLLNNSFTKVKGVRLLIIFAIVSRTPTWYLYSPTNLFRSSIFMVIIIYIITNFFNKQLKRIKV